MADCTCTNFPASLGNVTFGADVGIGTQAPQYSLHIAEGGAWPSTMLQGSDPASGVNHLLQADGRQWNLGVGGSANGNVANEFFLYDNNAGQFRLVLDTNGHVGIGTTSPTQLLHLQGGSLYINGGGILVSGDVTTGVGAFYAVTTKVADSGGCYYGG